MNRPFISGEQVTLFGKGGKTRAVLLSASMWEALQSIRREADADAPVFPSRKGKGHLDSPCTLSQAEGHEKRRVELRRLVIRIMVTKHGRPGL